jgi:hypothetical protein
MCKMHIILSLVMCVLEVTLLMVTESSQNMFGLLNNIIFVIISVLCFDGFVVALVIFGRMVWSEL